MSLKSRFRLLTIVIALGWSCLISTHSNAQGLGNSPYSSIGIGELLGEGYSDAYGMGHSGVSVGNGFQTNNLNPALWVKNRFTTLDFGMVGQYKDIVSGKDHQQNLGVNLGYVSLNFPVSTKWNLGVSLMPYSFIDYQNSFKRVIPDTRDTATYLTSGKGGLNKASVTNAFQIGKYLTVGLEASYFFGNVKKSYEVEITSLTIGDNANYDISYNNRIQVSGLSLRGGFALRVPVRKDNKMFLNVGGTYSVGNDLDASTTTTIESSSSGLPPDTLYNNIAGSMTLPSLFRTGVSLEWPYKLILSADYNHQNWSKYKGFTGNNDGLRNAGRFHVGAEYLPNFSSLNYFNIVRYRAGFSTGPTQYVLDGKGINDTNVSIGVTFPMGGRYSNYISVAFVGGQRGNSTATGMVRERYARMVLGLTLMDRWFVKQKLE